MTLINFFITKKDTIVRGALTTNRAKHNKKYPKTMMSFVLVIALRKNIEFSQFSRFFIVKATT